LTSPECTVFYCDDSSVARKQIERTLVSYGGERELQRLMVAKCGKKWIKWHLCSVNGQATSSIISLILTDIEMPEMDGYMLTKKVKSDPRFNGIPVVMHSSLSGMSNQKLGLSVGVDEYVPKFEPQRLVGDLGTAPGCGNRPLSAISA
jgi:two-component system chemotaxis response regulator CheV